MVDASDGLPIDIDAGSLGQIIRRVLQAGLSAPPRGPGPDDFDDELARRFGLKSGRSLYAGVRSVGLREADGVLTCTPTRHGRGFYFEAFPAVWKDQQPIRVASDASNAAWGATALEALSRSV